jgi:glycosyltransferase involved in cell wall biosynthesis
VFLFPSVTETFGNVTLEAMASGVPAVCADAPGSDALVVPGTTGFLAEPGNAESMASHVERLVLDADLRKSMGHASRKESLRYAWTTVLDRMVGYYSEVLELPSRNGHSVSDRILVEAQ